MKNSIEQGIMDYIIDMEEAEAASIIQDAANQREWDIESQIDKMWEAVSSKEEHKIFTIEAAAMRATI